MRLEKIKSIRQTYLFISCLFISFLFLIFFIFSCQKETTGTFKNNNSTYRFDLHPGASARDLLSDSLYTSLTVQIQYIDSAAPDKTTVNNLKMMLVKYLNKPGGIYILSRQIKPSSTLFTVDGIKGIEEKNRTVFTNGRNLGVYVLFVNGYYAADSLVLGVTYRNTSMVIFANSINDISKSDSISTSILTSTVLEHEFGHLMGLVDEGTPMIVNHRDPDHGNHCINPLCLMYYAGTDASYNLGQNGWGTAVPELDSNCVADLRAISGK
jgi:hypothetical protein